MNKTRVLDKKIDKSLTLLELKGSLWTANMRVYMVVNYRESFYLVNLTLGYLIPISRTEDITEFYTQIKSIEIINT